MTRLSLVLYATIALLAAILLFACGSPSVNVEDFTRAAIEAQCDVEVACGGAASRDICIAEQEGVLSSARLVNAVHSGAIQYDGERAAQCLDELRGRGCDVSGSDWRRNPAACTDALKGTRGTGQGCYFSGECQSAECVPPSADGCTLACCPGTCAAPLPSVAAGQPCGNATCDGGLSCVGGVCAHLLAEGQACKFLTDCADGLLCSGTPGSAICARPPKVGDACVAGGCFDLGLACDGATHKCARRLAAGAACTIGVDAVPCEDGLACAKGSCAPLPVIGQPCDGACGIGYCASSGTCAAPLADGQGCTTSDQCVSRVCDTATATCKAAPSCS